LDETISGTPYFIDQNDSYFVYFDDLEAGEYYKLVIEAPFIYPGETRKVFFTYFWEDLSRDDGNGPCRQQGWCGESHTKYLFYR